MKAKRKRLVQGKDYHAWAWKAKSNDRLNGLFFYAEPYKPAGPGSRNQTHTEQPSEQGKWVRVKFVEVNRR